MNFLGATTAGAPDESCAPAESRLAREREECRFVWAPLLLVIAMLWLVPMGTGLGLDEAGNFWVIKDGLKAAAVRSNQWSGGQSLLFDALAIAARDIGGASDFVLHIPSVLAMLLAEFFIFKIGKRFMGPLAATLACLAFASMPEIVDVASTLRPYALGIAFLSGAMWALICWFDSGKRRYGVLFSIFAALTIYAHYFFGTMFVVEAVYGFDRIRKGGSVVKLRAFLSAMAASGVLLLPLLPQVLWLFSNRGQLSYLDIPSVTDILASIVPLLLAGGIAVGLLICVILRRPISFSQEIDGGAAWVFTLWAITPPAVLLAISLLTNVRIFAGRYYIAAAPGVALMAGGLIRSLGPARIRRAVAGSISICAVLATGVVGQFRRGTKDWRGAVAAVNARIGKSDTPVLVIPGFQEGQTLKAVLDPERSEVLFAPLVRYPVAGRVIKLPWGLTKDTEGYIENAVLPQLRDRKQFVILGLLPASYYSEWFSGRCWPLGFRQTATGDFGGVGVYIFERQEFSSAAN